MSEQTATLTESAAARLEKFLQNRFGANVETAIQPLTPDASTREFLRCKWEDATAIACVYAEKFVPAEQNYLDATNLFVAAGLPIAELYDFDGELGTIITEDFGDYILRDALEKAAGAAREDLFNQAITKIAEIQAATPLAFELDAIASKLAFDFDKLSWELDFFTKHYFESLRGEKLSETDAQNLKTELDEVARELGDRAKVLTHRDFHAANLMIDGENRLRIIDHQDARIGAATYDLVSLLLDRIDAPPAESWIAAKQRFFLAERERLNLEELDFDEFQLEFHLQTIQRCLKAIGTFSFQTAVRGKPNYRQYIAPMFEVVRQAAAKLNRFPHLQQIISDEVDDK